MKKLTFKSLVQSNATVLENEFIDYYMSNANGEYVKVYLLLLRHINNPDGPLSISAIADMLDNTEKDVIRALAYWKRQGLLDYETDESVPLIKPKIQPYRDHRARKDLKELLFVAQQYLGKTLSATEIDAITYFYDTLHMSTDLIEYLIEYCVENDHKSIHYIQKVALSWSEQKITTVAEAKTSTLLYNKSCHSILNAYGIKGRTPAPAELTYIRKWSEEYSFSLEIIVEACNRTMNAIHQPSFSYTDSILKNWFAEGVSSIKDIEAIDARHQSEKEQRKNVARTPALQSSKTNKFNNFEERSYNMDDLERKLVQ